MPDTLQFDFTQNYENLSLSGAAGAAAGAAIQKLNDGGGAGAAVGAAGTAALISAGKSYLASKVGEGVAGVGAFLAVGAVINPLLEVVKSSSTKVKSECLS